MNCYLFQYNYKHKKILFHSRERKNYSVLQAYTLSYLYPEEAKKKKKEKKWDSCFINLLSPHSFIVLIMTPSMSPFIFQKPVNFLFDCSFILRFDFAKNYKWSSQKKFIAPREYYFIWDWNTN